MAEENNQAPEITPISGENQAEEVDNRLPYEKPELRKHGKIHDATKTVLLLAPRFDSRFGANRFDIS